MTEDQRYATHYPEEALILMDVDAKTLKRAKAVRLMVFDVDGVMTDGSLNYGENGEIFKRFHAQDGCGLRLLQESGITVTFITGRKSKILEHRAADIGITEVIQGAHNKGDALCEMMQRLGGISSIEVGFMGDDIIDLPAMRLANFAATVPHAPLYVTKSANWVSTLPGGNGAVRECCDFLLAAQGKLGPLLASPNILTLGALQ